MKTIALVMAYNESELITRCLENIYDIADQIIVFEGTVSPFEDQSAHSEDNTDSQILSFIYSKTHYNIDLNRFTNKIVYWRPYNKNPDIKTREYYEAWVKNEMLKHSIIEHGDLIWMVDVDEFYNPSGAEAIIEFFQMNDHVIHAPIGEWQFAYNMKLAFKASHNGRFMRYVDGAKYSASQHFIYPDGRDISKDPGTFMSFEISSMHHLCWVKHPELIKQKVLTFKRPSFTAWYNHCYLVWPINPEMAYKNNQMISQANGWPGTGFAEGQTEKLQNFSGKLPEVLRDYKVDYLDFIKENAGKLVIR